VPEVGQRLAGRDPHLRTHQVDVGDLLGHGVLDLDARVHLDEDVVARGVEQELDGAGAGVADLLGEPHRVRAHAFPQLRVEIGGGGDLDDLLVAALHRAVTLEEVDHLTGAVGEDLHLDVTRLDHGLLDEDGRVTEGRLALAHAGLDRLAQFVGGVDPSHPATTATRDRLHEQRVGKGRSGGDERVDVGGRLDRLQGRYAGSLGRRDRGGLVAGEREDLRRRSDERDPRPGAGLGQRRVLGEEPVAGVDGVRAALLGDLDDRVWIEIGPDRVTELSDLVGLVGLQPVL